MSKTLAISSRLTAEMAAPLTATAPPKWEVKDWEWSPRPYQMSNKIKHKKMRRKGRTLPMTNLKLAPQPKSSTISPFLKSSSLRPKGKTLNWIKEKRRTPQVHQINERANQQRCLVTRGSPLIPCQWLETHLKQSSCHLLTGIWILRN